MLSTQRTLFSEITMNTYPGEEWWKYSYGESDDHFRGHRDGYVPKNTYRSLDDWDSALLRST